ncbi:MAG: hypothetical protein U5K38_15680 [Woeseiaceae bacterium]|nr:hypothetical protein [Woeseiaceae bacterium]
METRRAIEAADNALPAWQQKPAKEHRACYAGFST